MRGFVEDLCVGDCDWVEGDVVVVGVGVGGYVVLCCCGDDLMCVGVVKVCDDDGVLCCE